MKQLTKKYKTEKYECDECHCEFDCSYYYDSNKDKIFLPNYAKLNDEEPIFFCSLKCMDEFINRGGGISMKNINKIIDSIDSELKYNQ